MSAVDIIKKLVATNSRLNKEAILDKVIGSADEQDFFGGATLALSKFVTFGVKQIPERTGKNGPGLKHDDFALLVSGLVDRSFTGNSARELVDKMMQRATNDEWNYWYRRILLKDLDCGMSEKTINKICKKAKRDDLMVPVFECQLAVDSEGEVPTDTRAIEVKLDGVRVLTFIYPTKADPMDASTPFPNAVVEQYSRNGKELTNFTGIVQEITVAGNLFMEPMVLDGEVMSASFRDLMTQVRRKTNVDTKDAVLHLFDIIPLSDFKRGRCDEKLSVRRKRLESFFKTTAHLMPHVEILGQEVLNLGTKQGQTRFAKLNAEAIKNGYEGLMMKDPESPYICKRKDSWYKMKPFIEVSLAIVDFEEGTKKNQGKLGAFVCEGVDSGKKIRVNVGSGFTDKQRDEYWKNRKKLVGDIVEVRADAITQNQAGDYSLRFPRFKTFRGFEPGEKI